jgi:hypothetical protein
MITDAQAAAVRQILKHETCVCADCEAARALLGRPLLDAPDDLGHHGPKARDRR